MNQTKSSIELKALARQQLTGKYGIVITALLISGFIISFPTFVIEIISPTTPTSLGIFFSFLINLGLQLFASIFTVGAIRLYLNIACNCAPTITDIFYGFKNHTNKILLFTLFSFLISLLLILPSMVIGVLAFFTGSTLFLIIATILIILGMIGISIFSLAISQTVFLIVDLPNSSLTELVNMSIHIMNGHKARLFYLQISFIGLLLLSIFTCFIANLWLIPYMNVTFTNFYLNLMSIQTTSQLDHN